MKDIQRKFIIAPLAGLLLQPNLFLRSVKSFALGALGRALRDGHLHLLMALRVGPLTLRLGTRLTLRLLAVPIDLMLALPRRHLMLEALPFEFRLVHLLFEGGFVSALLRLARAAFRVGLSLDLGLL